MITLRNALPFAAALATAMAGCVAGIDGSGDDGPDPNPNNPPVVTPPPPPPPPPAVTAAVWKRGSLNPTYQLTPRAEYGKFTQKNVQMSDADFTSNAGNFISAFDRLSAVSQQISTERGTNVSIVPQADADRARLIPFRGNPSDVKILFDENGDATKAYVPLGGDFMSPGNEVAVVDLEDNSVDRIEVGVRPQRVAIAGGLVFVANQFSNYISIIDPTTDELLEDSAGNQVEIPTEFYGTDVIVVPKIPGSQDDENFWVYVANNWRSSVLKYGIRIVKSGINDAIVDVEITDPAGPQTPENKPAAEITGVGRNPFRLTLSQDQRSIFVANNRGGELGMITIATGATKRINFTSHTGEVTQINNKLYWGTGPAARGLPAQDEVPNIQTNAPAVRVTGLDNQPHIAHPGAQFDDTNAYNFEDVRNGVYQLDLNADLGDPKQAIYFTDDITPEEKFDEAQKILTGASAAMMVVNRAKNKAWIAQSGSDLIQTVNVRNNQFGLSDANLNIETQERPMALALDEDNDRILVANWGGETLQIFNIDNGNNIATIDLGYATADYPATNMERGEYFFYNTAHSNNGRKACAVGCHWDELLVDGIPYANGATANTAYHKVTPNFNQATTDSFFWNGSFKNGSYASLASDAQARTNCELIAFGLIEGSFSDVNDRIGDPANRITNANDAQCRPDTAGPGVLPANFDTILAVSAQQKIVRNQLFLDVTGLAFDDVTRLTDFYSASELRLPPNPIAYLRDQGELPSNVAAQITRGQQVFNEAACGGCHQPNNTRAPFTDGKEHGAGADWRERFIEEYDNNPKLLNIFAAGIPQAMKDAQSFSTPDKEINIHLDPIDYFEPFCFDVNECLVFEDPLAAKGNNNLEIERLEALTLVNLANADRGFVPGAVRGQPAVNTPSLRGIWWQGNFLRHGLANTLNEAILAPGHQALRDGELGYAMDRLGNIDVHGITSTLSQEDVDALYVYLTSIE
jgi:DNA-binding beta-propeller fold protein YncE/cytochrome c peroxidase